MTDIKIIWRVDPVPTGPYASFQKRGWPSAETADQKHLAALYCENDYRPADIKTGNHAEIKVCIADHSQTPWKRRTLSRRAKTLAEAKALVKTFYLAHPEMLPK